MKKVIVISGVPATGKTTLAKLLAKEFSFTYVDVNKVMEEHNLCEDYDKARHCNVVDIEKLNPALLKIIDSSEESLVIDSHMAHFLPKEKVDLVIITKCKLKELKKRLEKRDYPAAKVRENLDSEIFDICLTEAQEEGHRILQVNTEKEIDVKKIKDVLDLKN